MKKKVTVAVAIIAVLFLVINGVFINATSHTGNQLKSALSEKYGWEKSDIKILKHKNAHYEHDFGFFGLDAPSPMVWRINEKWVCNYNGREFNVEYTDNQFADDYQLEDIFKWCTEYLQENVDPDIVGVEIASDIIYHSSENEFTYPLSWDSNKVFNKNDSEKLLYELTKQQEQSSICVFYKVSNVYYYGKPQKSSESILYGNDNYLEFCKDKKKKLEKNELTKDVRIVLVDNVKFNRAFYSVGIAYYQSIYSIDISVNKYVRGFFWNN